MKMSKIAFGSALLCLLLWSSDGRRLGDESPQVLEVQNISDSADGLLQYSEHNVEHEEWWSWSKKAVKSAKKAVKSIKEWLPWTKTVKFNKVAKPFSTLHHELGGNKGVMNWLRRLMAAAASDIYNMQPTCFVGSPARLEVKKCVHQETDGHIRWAIYEIKFPKQSLLNAINGKRILVFRGTANFENVLQDVSLATGGDTFEDLYQHAVEIAEREKPDFVTGHSLGGAVAEAVALHGNIPGMSFNGPVICSSHKHVNFCKKGKPGSGPPFEVWLTEGDPVSEMTSLSKAFTKGLRESTDLHHISEPHWVECDRSNKHNMVCMFTGDHPAIKPITGATLVEDEDERTDHLKCE